MLRADLIDGRTVEIDPAALQMGAADALYARLPGGELARLTRAAQLSLADRISEGPPGTFALEAGGRRHPIGRI